MNIIDKIRNAMNRVKLSNDEYFLNRLIYKQARKIVRERMRDYFETLYPNYPRHAINMMVVEEMKNADKLKLKKLASISLLEEVK